MGMMKPRRNAKLTKIPVDDLAAIENLNQHTMLDALRDRYLKDLQIFTYVGEILVAINPYRDIGVNCPREMNRYR